MKLQSLILTVFATDRPGIIRVLSDVVLKTQGNWLESSLSRLGGQFAGIVHITIPEGTYDNLRGALKSLSDEGIDVTIHAAVPELEKRADQSSDAPLEVVVEANDRPGIVEEITTSLSSADINVEQMETECVSASMAGYDLFRAYLEVSLPDGYTIEQLETLLEGVSDDLVVHIVADDSLVNS